MMKTMVSGGDKKVGWSNNNKYGIKVELREEIKTIFTHGWKSCVWEKESKS